MTRIPAPSNSEFDVLFAAAARRSDTFRLASTTVVVTPIVNAKRLRKLRPSGAFLLTGRT